MRSPFRSGSRSTVGLLLFLLLGLIVSALPRTVSAAPTGTYFDHIIIIAMENQNYGSVIGSSSAPFINSLAGAGTTISNYHSYGQGIGGCSAGCYEAFTAGQNHISDSWCPRASSPCSSEATIADQLQTAGLSSAMFCEDGCPRGADHFPWIGYTNTWNSCVTGSFTCNGQTGPDGNYLYGSSSSNGNSAFMSYLNSATPANYIWFTPTDSHNMHDNSVSSGDAYIQNLLVGSGSLSSPSANSVLGTSLWTAGHTMLYLWWDEYDPSPNVEYGPMIKVGYTSTGGYTEYDSLHTIEANWALPYITSVVSGDSGLTDIFGTGSGTGGAATFAGSISINPSSPAVNTSITFTATATGGTAPYTYSWSFGDGSTANGATPTHSFTHAGTYTVTMNATDSTGKTTTKTQTVSVGQTSPPGGLPNIAPTIAFLMLGLILGGAAGTIMYLARYHAHNQRLRDTMAERD